jgi:hypothetical protein
MRIIIGLICAAIWSNTCIAQLPDKKSGELWAVWEEAGKKLEAGRFDEAITLYRAYQPNFNFRLKQAQALKRLYSEGQKLQRAGDYAEAVNIYKKHRSLDGVGSLTVFDLRIEECIKQMAGGSASRAREPDRRILAAELAYQGQKKLRELDTLGAQKDYAQAKKYAADFPGPLKEQYEEGLQITKELREWGKLYLQSKRGRLRPEQEKQLLENYRKIKGVPVIDFVEVKVRQVTAEIEGKNSLISYANNCETDLLLNYINQNKSQLSFSEPLIATLNQYKSIQYKIGVLKSSNENSETVRSAYFSVDSMVRAVRQLPDDIRQSLLTCISRDRTKTFEGYADQARKSGNNSAARKFESIALGAGNNRGVGGSPCEGIDIFKSGIISIEQKLKSCEIAEARKIWNDISLELTDCSQKPEILRLNQGVLNAIEKMEVGERNFIAGLAEAKALLDERKLDDARVKYQQLSKIDACYAIGKQQEIKKGLEEISSRRIKPIYRFGLTAGVAVNQPSYKIASQRMKMDYGPLASGGINFSFIDHHNPIDISAGVKYVYTSYRTINADDYADGGYRLGGVGLSLHIKIHPSNTNPDKIRPYFSVGREEIIPLMYEYENYSTQEVVQGRRKLKNLISSLQAGVGLEMQKKHFGFFVEASGSYGMGGLYSGRNLEPGATKIDGRFRRLGLDFGVRFR